MTVFLQTLVTGTGIAALYVMLSIGVALIFGVLGLVNFAQGDFMTVAAYVGFTAVTSWKLGSLTAMVLMIPVLLVLGTTFFYGVVVPTRRHSSESQFIATFGVAFILQGLVQVVWTANPVSVPRSVGAVQIGGVTIPHILLIQVAITAVLLSALWLFLSRTKSGRAIRATAVDQTAAELMGINTRRAQLIAVLVSCVLSAAGGYMIMTTYVLNPTIGFSLIFSAFAVIVMAGLGSLGGAVVASVVLGFGTAFIGTYVNSSVTDAVPFLIILAVLVLRPAGLRGKSFA
jgi:branched-chain amino acid transport system permease protein